MLLQMALFHSFLWLSNILRLTFKLMVQVKQIYLPHVGVSHLVSQGQHSTKRLTLS